MLKFLIAFMLSTSFLPSCKSTSGGDSSELWSSPENRTATVNFIKKTVSELFPDVRADDPAVEKFAQALQDKETKQSESAQFLLSKYLEQRGQNPDDTNTDVATYISENFLAMTNYIAVYQKEASTLTYIGFEAPMQTAK